ncbi:MAG TPA: hypothetical protein VGI39_11215, partial [Polyangiaceae bacterium]
PSISADGGAIDGGYSALVDQQAISQYADAWVGDYVAKLRNFVTYYNVQYPSHQGEDTSILSLRYDLLPPTAQCSTQGPNLLTNSGDLSQFSASSWQLTPCAAGAQRCLAAIPGYALPGTPASPWGMQGTNSGGTAAVPAPSAVTWLLDVSQSGSGSGGGADGGAEAGAPASSWPTSLDNQVAQQVQLAAGSYVLSWWDQARDASGNVVSQKGLTSSGGATTPPGYAPPNYVVAVFDPQWKAAASFDQPPFLPPQVGDGGAAAGWSDRRVLSFTVTTAGQYTIAFGASTLAEAPGSVAIAAVQLEQAPGGQPSPYVGTQSTLQVQALNCPLSDANLRAAFHHGCDASGACYYDLDVPLIIDTSTLDGSPLGAKLAGGNYNYRQLTAALNLVGTGVHSCANDPSPNCYGSAYVQYDLRHDATNAALVAYDGNSRLFDFGIAGIQHGKALAAERYLTMPLSSSDQALMSQPGITHVEFGGRPVDGTYRLRIWDSPDLSWSALTDVQIILDYEYWSQVQVQNGEARHAPQRLKRAPIHPVVRAALAR